MIENLNEEQRLLQKTVKSFMEQEIYPHEEMVDKDGKVPIDLGRQIEKRSKEIGLFASNLPESVGGGGLDYEGMMVIEREFGKTTHALHSWVARPTEILLACKDGQVEKYLKPSVQGEKRELFALSEPEAGSDIMSMKTHAKKVDGNWIMNGSKHFISGPVMADFAIVFAKTGVDETAKGPRSRITAFLVDVGEKGFDINIGYQCTSYRGYLNFRLDFNDVKLGPKQILGEEGKGLEAAGKWLGMGRVWVGASCCGKAERLYEMAVDWAAKRNQFGQPIGRFQGTGFKVANMALNLRAADLLVIDAVKKAKNNSLNDADAAMVKLFCSEMLDQVADDTVQIYGGMGLMEDLPVHRLWRDSRLERIWDGTSEILRHIISRSIFRPLGA